MSVPCFFVIAFVSFDASIPCIASLFAAFTDRHSLQYPSPSRTTFFAAAQLSSVTFTFDEAFASAALERRTVASSRLRVAGA